MRYRALDQNYDPMFGQGQNNFLVNKAAVVQAIMTGLNLFLGERFEDMKSGIPMFQEVLGWRTAQVELDRIFRTGILGVQGVQWIEQFSSRYNGTTRTYSFSCTANTIYGSVTVTNIPTPRGLS